MSSTISQARLAFSGFTRKRAGYPKRSIDKMVHGAQHKLEVAKSLRLTVFRCLPRQLRKVIRSPTSG